eukprot:5984231-Pleurochrysis_carterae.AAC.1
MAEYQIVVITCMKLAGQRNAQKIFVVCMMYSFLFGCICDARYCSNAMRASVMARFLSSSYSMRARMPWRRFSDASNAA